MNYNEEQHLYDSATAEEVLVAYDAFSALGILSSPDHFHRVCRSFDKLMGRTSPTPAASDIVNDSTRSWYAPAAAYIMRQTRLEIDELSRALESVVEAKTDKRGHIDCIRQASDLTRIVLAFLQHIDFEPRWHQAKRGDDRPLPSDKGKDLWRYLRSMYTDSEYSRMRMPDNIRRAAPMYKGYEECVKKAVSEGHRRLQEIHGKDADLSPVTEIKDREDDFDGASFMRLLSKGSPFSQG